VYVSSSITCARFTYRTFPTCSTWDYPTTSTLVATYSHHYLLGFGGVYTS